MERFRIFAYWPSMNGRSSGFRYYVQRHRSNSYTQIRAARSRPSRSVQDCISSCLSMITPAIRLSASLRTSARRAFQCFKAEIENWGYGIKRFRCDNGRGEYDNTLFRRILAGSGISYEPASPPYTQHNVRLGRPEGVIDGGDDANSGGEWSPAHRGPSTSIFDRL